MELIKELGRRIQKARKEKGLTQQELADLSHVSLKHVQGCERGVKNPSFEVLRAFCKVLNLSLDSLMNLDLPEDEQAANDMRQLYLSCPPAARKVLLNSTRALTDELKEMVQTAGVDPYEHLGQHRTIAEASAVESPIRQETIGFPAHFFARAHNFKPPGRACQPEADSPMRT